MPYHILNYRARGPQLWLVSLGAWSGPKAHARITLASIEKQRIIEPDGIISHLVQAPDEHNSPGPLKQGWASLLSSFRTYSNRDARPIYLSFGAEGEVLRLLSVTTARARVVPGVLLLKGYAVRTQRELYADEGCYQEDTWGIA